MSASRHWARLQGSEKQARSSENMLPASSARSLRKKASDASSIYASPHGHALGEALDVKGRPLCIMPKNEILKQGLRCRKAAILATAPDKALLLAANPGPIFDVTCQDLVSAGWAIDGYAAWLLEKSLGIAASINFITVLLDGSVSISIFSANLSSAYLAAREDREFLLSHVAEIGDLGARGLTTPLLHSALQVINFLPD